jgi:protein-tyrosine-phosphatase
VISLVAHPLRWRLLRELARSDRTVRELTDLIDERQSLVSYHLRELHEGRLVSRHHSTADGRDTYYAVAPRACRAELEASARALHPGFAVGAHAAPDPPRAHVLFLCTGNSARSQMAEALTKHLSNGRTHAASAGSHPKLLHPNAVRVMRARGIDIADSRSKHLDELASERFDLVVTMCDRVREVCPELPSAPARAHWSMADPGQAGTTLRSSYPAFRSAAAEIEERVEFMLASLSSKRS